jgi:hypothetical protein
MSLPRVFIWHAETPRQRVFAEDELRILWAPGEGIQALVERLRPTPS